MNGTDNNAGTARRNVETIFSSSCQLKAPEPTVGLTRDLCVIIHGTSSTALGAECVDRVKQAIADGIAVALAGCRELPVAIGPEHARSLGGAPRASVWG